MLLDETKMALVMTLPKRQSSAPAAVAFTKLVPVTATRVPPRHEPEAGCTAVSVATPSDAAAGVGEAAESDAEHDRQAKERHALTVRSFAERDLARARDNGYCLAFTEEGTTRGTMVGLATIQVLRRNGALPAFKTSVPGTLLHKSFTRRLHTLNKCSQSIYSSVDKLANHWYLSSLSSKIESGKQAEVVLGM